MGFVFPEVPFQRVVDLRFLLLDKSKLDALVPIRFCPFYLDDHARTGLDHRYGDDVSILLEDLRHANFLSYNSLHGANYLLDTGARAAGRLKLDLHIDPCRKFELHQGIDGLLSGLKNIKKPLMSPDLELLPRFLVHMGRS